VKQVNPIFKKTLWALALAVGAGGAYVIPTGLVAAPAQPVPVKAPVPIVTLAGMPPVVDASNLYSETTAAKLSPTVQGHLPRIYVPNLRSHDVSVIDPATMKVVDRFKVGRAPQHIVPSWDMKTLWVANNAERRSTGSLTAIDPVTGKPGQTIDVDDPYNLYFTPDGKSAIVVAEAKARLDFRDPQTMALQYSIEAPQCAGINHGEFTIDGKLAFFTCEFKGSVAKINLETRKVEGYLKLSMPDTRFKVTKEPFDPSQSEICTSKKGMPQDIRISPEGKRLYIADMDADGVHVLDVASFTQVGFIPVGPGRCWCVEFRDRKSHLLLAHSRWRQPRYGQCQCRRPIPVALRPV
jgi:YVTN family beta-propeller protein